MVIIVIDLVSKKTHFILIYNYYYKECYKMLWQPLDQYSIAALQVNLSGRYLVENTSCVIHKRTWQGTTTVFYWLFI